MSIEKLESIKYHGIPWSCETFHCNSTDIFFWKLIFWKFQNHMGFCVTMKKRNLWNPMAFFSEQNSMEFHGTWAYVVQVPWNSMERQLSSEYCSKSPWIYFIKLSLIDCHRSWKKCGKHIKTSHWMNFGMNSFNDISIRREVYTYNVAWEAA